MEPETKAGFMSDRGETLKLKSLKDSTPSPHCISYIITYHGNGCCDYTVIHLYTSGLSDHSNYTYVSQQKLQGESSFFYKYTLQCYYLDTYPLSLITEKLVIVSKSLAWILRKHIIKKIAIN